MPRPNRLPDLIEQLGFQRAWPRLNASFDIQATVDHREHAVFGAVHPDVIYHNDSPCHSVHRSTAVFFDDFVSVHGG
jgi:hypothetical protein